jgi:hypothetical protein
MQNYAADVVAASKGDVEAKIRVDAVNKYLETMGASGQRAATAAVTAATTVRDKARDNVDSSLSKNVNSPDNKRIRELQRQDRQNRQQGQESNLAQEYIDSLYAKEEARLQQTESRGAPAVPTAPPAAAGAPTATPTAARPTPAPAPAAVNMLRSNPSAERKRQFDEIYGPGAADRALAAR